MTDLEKRFLKNTDDTGRFIYQSLVTGRKYYVEPIGGHSDWGDINPATKEKIQIAAKKVAKFKAGAELADAINK